MARLAVGFLLLSSLLSPCHHFSSFWRSFYESLAVEDMLQACEIQQNHVVFELGTGTGALAARILSQYLGSDGKFYVCWCFCIFCLLPSFHSLLSLLALSVYCCEVISSLFLLVIASLFYAFFLFLLVCRVAPDFRVLTLVKQCMPSARFELLHLSPTTLLFILFVPVIMFH